MANKCKSLSSKLRFEIFKRDGFKCLYCGAHPPGALLQVDHITAVAVGGTNDIDNLVTSYQPCNIGKGARELTVTPQTLSDKAKETAEREAQIAGYQQILMAKRERLEEQTWEVMHTLFGDDVEQVPHDEFNGTRRFIERLGLADVLDSVDIARGARTIVVISPRRLFRYFAGVCWSKIRASEAHNDA